MAKCTNIRCGKEATEKVRFPGIGVYPYCKEHADSLKEIERTENNE